MRFLTLSLLACTATAAPVALGRLHHHNLHVRDDSPTATLTGDLAAYSETPTTFEDGTIPCSSFPSGEGVLAVDWVGLGGWASIMNAEGELSSTCKDGFYCSYACEPGMAKTQWPDAQPASGATLGGLYCQNGFLYRTNPEASSLCEWGSQTATVKSELDNVVSLCRTDYPGSENMVIPTELEAGSSLPLCVIDSENYFHYQGKQTSGQYYVNDAGISAEEGCIWGTPEKGVGNWAPLVIGAGYSGGNAYLSLIPNPNNLKAPNYNVEIVGAEGSKVVGECSYKNGVFSGNGADGCTVTVVSGSAEIHFS